MSALPERPNDIGTSQRGQSPTHDRGQAASAADEAHVHEIVRSSGTSFYGAMRTLPKEQRDAMFAIYAFCREIDDIADDPLPPDEKAAALTEWRAEIDRLYAGNPETPIGRVLMGPVARYDLLSKDFIALIDGMEMDANEVFHGPSMETLTLYCERVAGAVGMLSIRVFGEPGEAGERLAWSLGQALQLTNILRDVCEDCDRGRLYLPDELLSKHGIETRDPAAVLQQPSISEVCGDLSALAKQRFDEAIAAMHDCDRRKIRPAVVMMLVYRAILGKLIKRGWHRLDEPVKVSKATKLWIALRYGLL